MIFTPFWLMERRGIQAMSEYCVVVTDGARARFFTLDPVEFPDVEGSPRLTEQGNLINPERDLPQRELFSSATTGRNRAPEGGPAQGHGYDDHRNQHEDEFERRFARRVAEEASRVAQSTKARCVVLAAQPRMLGFLRQELTILLKSGFEVRESVKDLSKLSPVQIHEHLAKEQLLPARKRPRS
jgi:protein required for attachment to host cells